MFNKLRQIIAKIKFNEDGNALIETAVAVPVILGLFMGLLFYTNAMRYKVVMNMAAKEGARYYQATQNSSRAQDKSYEELELGRVEGATVKITDGGVEVTKSYGFYIPLFNRYVLNLKSKHDFFEELDHRYYQQGW